MNCKQFIKLIPDYTDGLLEAESRKNMQIHAASCEACRRELDCEEVVDSVFSGVKTDYPSPYVLDNVLKIVDQRSSSRSWLAPGLITAGACCIIMLMVVLFHPANQIFDIQKPNADIRIAVKNTDNSDNAAVKKNNIPAATEKKSAPVKKNLVPKKKTIRRTRPIDTMCKKSGRESVPEASSGYMVVLIPKLEIASSNNDIYEDRESTFTTENEEIYNSAYSITVNDSDTGKVTSLSVTNEITPELLPKNTIDYSVTDINKDTDDTGDQPERSMNYENNGMDYKPVSLPDLG